MDNLPNELIELILSKMNIDDIISLGLCKSNKRFRKHCNIISKKELQKRYNDYLQIYIDLKKLDNFYVCINTYEGETKFKTVKGGFNEIIDELKIMIKSLKLNNKDNFDITESIDNVSYPKMINIKYDNIDILKSINIVIQGNFKNYNNVLKLTDKITNILENTN